MSTTEEEPVAGSLSEKLRGWFSGRMPSDWFTEPPAITHDREEICVIGTLSPPEAAPSTTEAELRFGGRKVSWGVNCGERRVMFTTISVPVMTRLRQSERLVLDTLVDAGVARSRSDALAWCVRLVGQHEDSWLADLREALRHVEQVRSAGPRS